MNNSVMHTYNRLPVEFVSGSGAWLTDAAGEKYLDALSGISVCSLGHAHPEITRVLSEQAGQLMHTSNLYEIPLQEKLAARLCELSGLDKVFFGNSGGEANEAAIKICRKYGHEQGLDKPVIVVMAGSFHGRTMATLSATGNAKIRDGFSPLVEGFVHIPYGDIPALEQIHSTNPNIVAVMLEPVQGEGGIVCPPDGFLSAVRKLCSEKNWFMILDEIQTGMCRTGEWFAWQHEQARPDIMTLAKALGNGVPIGACVATDKAAEVLQPGNHGSTFGGNPLAARSGNTVIDIMDRQALAQRAAQLGTMMLSRFEQELGSLPGVKQIRGKGLMLGIELDKDCGALVKMALQEHLLINVTAGNVIRLLPPLIISDEEADTIVSSLSSLIRKFFSG